MTVPEREFRGGPSGGVTADFDQEQMRLIDIVRGAKQFILTATDAEVSPTEVGVRVGYAFRVLPVDKKQAIAGTILVFEMVRDALNDEIASLREAALVDDDNE